MITRDNQKEKLCQEALDVMKLSASNRQLIEEYLESAGDEKDRKSTRLNSSHR